MGNMQCIAESLGTAHIFPKRDQARELRNMIVKGLCQRNILECAQEADLLLWPGLLIWRLEERNPINRL